MLLSSRRILARLTALSRQSSLCSGDLLERSTPPMFYRGDLSWRSVSTHTVGHIGRTSSEKSVHSIRNRPSAHRSAQLGLPCSISHRPPDGCLSGIRRKCHPFLRPPNSSFSLACSFGFLKWRFWTLSTLGSRIVGILFSLVPLAVASSLYGEGLSSPLSSPSAENS